MITTKGRFQRLSKGDPQLSLEESWSKDYGSCTAAPASPLFANGRPGRRAVAVQNVPHTHRQSICDLPSMNAENETNSNH